MLAVQRRWSPAAVAMCHCPGWYSLRGGRHRRTFCCPIGPERQKVLPRLHRLHGERTKRELMSVDEMAGRQRCDGRVGQAGACLGLGGAAPESW